MKKVIGTAIFLGVICFLYVNQPKETLYVYERKNNGWDAKYTIRQYKGEEEHRYTLKKNKQNEEIKNITIEFMNPISSKLHIPNINQKAFHIDNALLKKTNQPSDTFESVNLIQIKVIWNDKEEIISLSKTEMNTNNNIFDFF